MSLRTKFLIVVGSIVAGSILVVSLLSSRIARVEFERVDTGPREIPVEKVAWEALREQLADRRELSGSSVVPIEPGVVPDGWTLVVFERDRLIASTSLPADLAIRRFGDEVEIERDDGSTLAVSRFSGVTREIPVGWGGEAIAMMIPSTEMEGPDPSASRTEGFIRPFNRSLLLGSVFVMLLALGVTWWIVSRFLHPIATLRSAAAEIAGGNFGSQLQLDRKDELGELSRSFDSMSAELARLERNRQSMVSDIAHELRTPLTSVRCRVEAIRDGLQAADRSTVDAIHEQLLLLTSLVDDLQDLSLATAGRLPLDIQPAELRGEVSRVLESLPESEALRVNSVDDHLWVVADPRRLRQILTNLLTNAVRHAGAEGSVVIRADREDGMARIWVEDNGEGIAPESLEMVFERFHRIDESRSRETGGTGLGLAIVRQLVEAHGGEVGVESEQGDGARFWFTLPAVAPETKPEATRN